MPPARASPTSWARRTPRRRDTPTRAADRVVEAAEVVDARSALGKALGQIVRVANVAHEHQIDVQLAATWASRSWFLRGSTLATFSKNGPVDSEASPKQLGIGRRGELGVDAVGNGRELFRRQPRTPRPTGRTPPASWAARGRPRCNRSWISPSGKRRAVLGREPQHGRNHQRQADPFDVVAESSSSRLAPKNSAPGRRDSNCGRQGSNSKTSTPCDSSACLHLSNWISPPPGQA